MSLRSYRFISLAKQKMRGLNVFNFKNKIFYFSFLYVDLNSIVYFLCIQKLLLCHLEQKIQNFLTLTYNIVIA